MGNFNPKLLAEVTKKIKKAKGGSTIVLDARRMEPDVPQSIRLVKPKGNQGGEWVYLVEGIGYWINKQFYRSLATFGKPCPITEEVEKAKSLNSPAIKKLLDDWSSFSKDYALYMPIVPVDAEIDLSTGEVENVRVDGEQRVLKAPVSMADDIQKIVLNPKTVAGSGGAGIFHQKLGYSISIMKTGKGIDTKYHATLEPQRVPLSDEVYEPYDIMAMFKKELRPEKEMRAAIRAYLYGEEEDSMDEQSEDKPNKEFADLEGSETLEMSLEEDLGDLEDL